MKIHVYEIDTVKPKNEDEYESYCEIFGTPTLKFGYAEFIGKRTRTITKGELKNMKGIAARYYDRGAEVWREGVLLTEFVNKTFAEYNHPVS